MHLNASLVYAACALLQLRILLPPLRRNLFLRELPCLASEHLYALFMRELHLIAHGNQATSNVVVVFPQQIDGKKHVVDVVEHQSMLI
jgi:hypothetical protein